MNIKPELLATLSLLGVTEEELPLLQDQMLSLVTSLQAEANALSAQIETLAAQKLEVEARLVAGQAIAAKLLDPGPVSGRTPQAES